MTDKQTPFDWNPREDSVLRDQRHAYDALRETCPVAHSEFLGWSLFRHEDIAGVLADPETYSSASHHRAIPNGMDPPEHTLYRHLLEPYFTAERMDTFASQFRQIAGNLLEKIESRGDVEFVSEFAEPFSLESHCAFLGWPPEFWEHLLGWNHGNQQVAFSRDRATGKALALAFAGYVSNALEARRTAGVDPAKDLTSHLMASEVEGKTLTDDDIVSILRNWTAGQGTVSASLGILVHYLAAHPDMQQRLRGEPGLIPAAIEEILRRDGPLVANRRITTKHVEIEGRSIEAGEKLTLMWIAANRDARTFDDPDQVRLDRDPEGNFLFGAGIHDCVGAPLARLEMRIALEELLARNGNIALTDTNPPERAIYPSNGISELPICMT
ncbi:MAG: cytochrome P450 [Thermomicrobiales bacterium]